MSQILESIKYSVKLLNLPSILQANPTPPLFPQGYNKPQQLYSTALPLKRTP